ncbi:tannase/feruloyl esterase family alpha/beta hydrolase [Microbacterium halophytorum]|uniref:tannase/feruloyl esterase family alpha/beta hydrolase n=1 Tax=Microbacterium halophytorum TaxID=2067568 RepID=UPI000CFD085A|nr:tannase/feruloyl esterase family alpha/beta hydrolase [Microbacterium halophytorum]
MRKLPRLLVGLAAAAGLTLSATAALAAPPTAPPQVVPAQPGTLAECTALADFAYEDTQIDTVELVPAGALQNAGEDIGEHCLVQGRMNERVSEVDGQTYAIGFEMRLPTDWSGRFLYQANGGMDGNVNTAMGAPMRGQLENGLQKGFAVISADAGHSGAQNPLFGLDPQARLDYGYQAVGTLTPMAKELIAEAYGRGPDTSYIAGGSNGGRHTMVAATRYADQYDGFLPVAPGFNLPQAAVAQIWGAQQWNTVATTPGDLESAFTAEERSVVSQAILDRCDGIDRLVDGIVADGERCAKFFDVERDIPSCEGDRDGTCLSAAQKEVLDRVMAGAATSDGDAIYTSFPWDAGISNSGWAGWKLGASIALDPMAVGFVFSPEPEDPSILSDLPGYALALDIDEKAAGIWEQGIAGESAMDFMTPVGDDTGLDTLRDTGAKMLVVHGASDGVFSPDDTARWYGEVSDRYKDARDFVRYFEVPGMAHVQGGQATDQFDALGTLVSWVEQGEAPDRIVATARGAGNPAGANNEVPADWSADRTRPLCPYPEVARYTGGDPESAESFACKPSSGEPGSAR